MTSPQVDSAEARVSEGAGARRREGGRRNSRSSWPRPCRRSAPPAPPAGLSAPVARGPPSSRAGSGRARRPGRPERLGGRLRARLEPVCRKDRPTKRAAEATARKLRLELRPRDRARGGCGCCACRGRTTPCGSAHAA